MSVKKIFTTEEVETLRANPYTASVTPTIIRFTLEFKKEFWRLSAEGCTGNQAFRKLGYDVWYCNQRYKNGKNCNTPFLREDEIRRAFECVLEIRKEKAEFSEKRWRELVSEINVQPDRKLVFALTDGTEQTIAL